MPLSHPHRPVLGEAVAIDGDLLLLALVVLLVTAAAAGTVVALGFRAALRAGRGSDRDLSAWLAILGIEALPLLVAGAVTDLAAPVLGVIGLQVATYVGARAAATRGDRARQR